MDIKQKQNNSVSPKASSLIWIVLVIILALVLIFVIWWMMNDKLEAKDLDIATLRDQKMNAEKERDQLRINAASKTEQDVVTQTTNETTEEKVEECLFEASDYDSDKPFEQVIVKYFDAILSGNYELAYNMLSTDTKNKFNADHEAFESYMKQNLSCAKVKNITIVSDIARCPAMSASMGMQCYDVELEGSYEANKISTFYLIHSDPHADGDVVENASVTDME